MIDDATELPIAVDVAKSDYVLIVDGDAPFARLLKKELTSIGLETMPVSDAETAARLLAGTSPRAMVIDLRLAGLPGAATSVSSPRRSALRKRQRRSSPKA